MRNVKWVLNKAILKAVNLFRETDSRLQIIVYVRRIDTIMQQDIRVNMGIVGTKTEDDVIKPVDTLDDSQVEQLESDREIEDTIPFTISDMCVKVTINEVPIKALLDTGSGLTLINLAIVNKIKGVVMCKPVLTEIRGISNKPLPVYGAVELSVCFGKQSHVLFCHVMDNLSFDMVLGTDTMKQVISGFDLINGRLRLVNKSARDDDEKPCLVNKSYALHPHIKCEVEKGAGFLGKRFFTFLVFFLMFFGYLCTPVLGNRTPDIGAIYNCEQTQHEGIFAPPSERSCQRHFNTSKLTVLSAEVRQYKQEITNVELFYCEAEHVVKECKENFLGVDDKQVHANSVRVTKRQCYTAVRSFISPYGQLIPVGVNKWRSARIGRISVHG